MIQFIVQFASLQVTSIITKIRFNMLIWFLNFLIIVSVNIRKVRFISFAICIKSFIILCHFMHLVSSHIKWWMLKFLISRCSSDLLSSYCKLYMREFLLTFCKNSENSKYTLWIYSIMFFSLKISDEKSDFECFIVQDEIRIFLFIKKHAQLQCCCK